MVGVAWPEARSILRLAFPIAITQIGMVLYGVVAMIFVGRHFQQSLGVTAPLVVGIGVVNLANALLDPALIFGRFGAPALGVRGPAVATQAANGVMLIVAALAAASRLRSIAFRFHGWHR